MRQLTKVCLTGGMREQHRALPMRWPEKPITQCDPTHGFVLQQIEYALSFDSEGRGDPEVQNCRSWRFLAACLVWC